MHILLFVLGLLLIAAGTLLYSTEEKRLQSRIEDLWLLSAELRPSSQTRLTSVVAAAATTVLRMIDRFFDKRLFSIYAAASAIVTSAYSTAMVLGVMMIGWQVSTTRENLVRSALATIVTAIAVRYRWTRIPAAVFIIVCSVLGMQIRGDLRQMIIAIYVGAVTDLVALFLIRSALRRFLDLKTFQSALWLLAMHASLVFLVIAPIALGSRVKHPLQDYRLTILLGYTQMWSCSNAFVLIAAMTLITVLLLMLVHRVVWPVIERVLYGIARFGVFEHRVGLITTGLGLVCASSPWAAGAVASLRKMLGM